jgi:hypothetical protein
VAHVGMFVAPGYNSPAASSRWHYGEKTTGLSGVEFGVPGVKACAPMVVCGVRPTARRTGQRTMHYPVHHQTVRRAAESTTFLQLLVLCWGL